jgi:YggT family protein
MGAIVGNILMGLAQVLDMVLWLYMWAIIIHALLSFVRPDPYNAIVRFLNQITDPVLLWLRRRIPTTFGGLDFSPLIVILAINFLQWALVKNLRHLALKFGATF